MFYKLDNEKINLYNQRQKQLDFSKFSNDLTIISNTCLGGRLYHDYHQKFLTPTIDFYMEPSDFVKFCLDLKYYLNCEIKPLKELKYNNLKGFLFCNIGGLTACFAHTNNSFEKIINKWNSRKLRVNYDNIIVIATDRNILTNPVTRCSENVIIEFGKIPYKKVIFSVKEYNYDYVSYLSSFCSKNACPEATRPSISKNGKYIVEENGFDLDKFICESK